MAKSTYSHLLNTIGITKELILSIIEDREYFLQNIGKYREALENLLVYIIINMNNSDFDQSLIILLKSILGIKIKKEERDFEDDEKIREEEKENYMRFIIYEAYKIINPHRIAGETELENFISNIKVRGLKEARRYSKNHADFEESLGLATVKDLNNSRESFVEILKNQGFKGNGRGFC